jgi:hypothetical protein
MFLASGLTTAFVVACGSSESSSGISPDRLGVRFPDGVQARSVAVAGGSPQRFPFVVIANDGFPMTAVNAPEAIEVELRFEDETLDTLSIARRGSGQVIPFYPLVFTPEVPGRYFVKASFSDVNVEFEVLDRADVSLVQVGEQLPGFDTPTFDNERGVTPVCTRAEPCPFHEITLAEAVSNGAPTALLISTPEFCQTDVCGPSLEHLIEATATRPDINVVHAEVFADPRNPAGQFPELSPIIKAWELEFEPSLFVADADGTIVQALHFAFDRDETIEAVGLI